MWLQIDDGTEFDLLRFPNDMFEDAADCHARLDRVDYFDITGVITHRWWKLIEKKYVPLRVFQVQTFMASSLWCFLLICLVIFGTIGKLREIINLRLFPMNEVLYHTAMEKGKMYVFAPMVSDLEFELDLLKSNCLDWGSICCCFRRN